MKSTSIVLTCLMTLVLSACGGGSGGGGADSASSSSSSSSGSAIVTVTGVAASGIPISNGTVTFKDAKGAIKSTITGGDGTYSIDVTGLTAPFVLEAIGMASGNQIVLHSVIASTPSASSVVANITPLTEAIVANVGGGNPYAFFAAPDYAKVTPAAVKAAQDSLKAALSSMLKAAGLPATVDFLTTAFVANKTGMDAVLESVKVTTTVVNGTPVIRIANKLDDDQVVTLTGSGAAAQTGSLAQTTLPDLLKLDALAGRFTAAMASQDALTNQLPALFEDSYLEMGQGKATAVEKLQSGSEQGVSLVGATAGLPVIVGCNATSDTCRVKIALRYAGSNGGYTIERSVRKQQDGSWKFYGNQYHHDFSLAVYANKVIRTDGVASPATETGIQFSGYQSAILYSQGSSGGADVELLKASGMTQGFHSMSDADIDQLVKNIGSNTKFRIRLFSDANYTTPAGDGTEGNGVYSNLRLDGLPLKSAQLASAPFPTLTSGAIKNLKALGASGPLTLSWVDNPQAPVLSVSATFAPTGQSRYFARGGLFGLSQVTLQQIGTGTAGAATVTTSRSAWLWAEDSTGRSYTTSYAGCGGLVTCASYY